MTNYDAKASTHQLESFGNIRARQLEQVLLVKLFKHEGFDFCEVVEYEHSD